MPIVDDLSGNTSDNDQHIDTPTDGINISDMAQTWNAGATTFTAIKMNVTDTASAAGSSLLDLQVGGVSRFIVRKDGNIGIGVAPGALALQIETLTNGSNGFFVRNTSAGSSASAIVSVNSDSAAVTLAAHSAASSVWPDMATLISSPTASGGLQITTATTAPIGFWTNSTARWQIVSAGDLLPAAGNTYNIGSSSFTVASVNANNLRVASTLGSLTFGASNDVVVTRDAADVLAQRNGVNAQSFRVYNTFTDASNYERANVGWSSSIFRVGTEAQGTGAARPLILGGSSTTFRFGGVGGTDCWGMNTSGHFVAATDNTFDIGASGGNRPRNIFAAGYMSSAGSVFVGGQIEILGTSAGVGTIRQFAVSDFNRLTLGGTSSAFPSIKRSGTGIDFRLADDSAFTGIGAASVSVAASTTARPHFALTAGVAPTSPANGDIWFDGTDMKIRIGGVTKTFTII